MLTRTQIEAVKPQPKPVRLFDGRGLYLEVSPAGGRLWRFKYRFAGKERRLALGIYPDVGIVMARERLDAARKLIAAGIDPGEQRKSEKLARFAGATGDTFEAVAREWFNLNKPKWAPNHSSKIIDRLERDVFAWIGKRSIKELTAPELLAVVRRIESRGAIETAHRALQNCGQVLRYAEATGRGNRDFTPSLRGALAPKIEKHFAAITEPARVGVLMRAIDSYPGSFVTKCALQLVALTFVRSAELRKAEWCEINFDAAEWRIPPHRMKKRHLHIVPLASQAIEVLRELQPLSGDGKYLFPSEVSRVRHMSENTVNTALRRMGYTNQEVTGHGFRSMASTLLNEQGWPPDAIERQLAHAEENATRGAYNYAEYLPERRRMMQSWADFLDRLRRTDTSTIVTPATADQLRAPAA